MEAIRLLSSRTAFRSSSACLTSQSRVLKYGTFQRHLHGGRAQYAVPVNHPNVPGPPPQPPSVAVGQPEDTTARKQKQAELLRRGQALKVDPAKPTSALRKRFWKEVSVKEVEDGLQVLLDTRPVRTASKEILTLPHSKRGLATAIALEWDQLVSAQQALKQHYIPITSLTSRAVDIRVADSQGNTKVREEIVKMMMRYLSTDTLLCWEPGNSNNDRAGMNSGYTGQGQAPTESLRARQAAVAEPIIAHLTSHVFPGAEIEPILDEDSIMPKSQPEMTQQIIKGWLHGLPPFELAALERGVLATKSLLIAVRLLVEWSQTFKHLQDEKTSQGSKFGIAQAAEASTVEVTWQTGMWGEVEDTHDVEKEDLARQLGSVVLLVS
ncbi:Protein atp12, mitochondrial [Elsinoe australis]|uniref:Protein atp12, mitochondrial n=1 Tax=Elsinoe australis TaxID=40998 RepID=A0A2P7ZK70_9PEZI|nr:Protein atp12, mitochondrial [Elsinoe australis]